MVRAAAGATTAKSPTACSGSWAPARYGPWQTVYDRFVRWRRAGLFDRMLERLHLRLNAEGQIDWQVWCVDATNIRASQAAVGGGKRGLRTNRKTTPSAARAEASAPSSTG